MGERQDGQRPADAPVAEDDVKTPPCPTPHKALSAAITRAMEEPTSGFLSEVFFIRYAAQDTGWGFKLVFTREVRECGRPEIDALARRVCFIVDSWERSRVVREACAAEGPRRQEGEER
jgi:hypothetical protein